MRSNKCGFLIFLFMLIFLLAGSVLAQTISINEVVSANFDSAHDEDGDTVDWIELYNSGSSSVNLLNYGLSDDSAELDKWTFPDKILEPNDYLLVFASGKNRRLNPYWETVIDSGAVWTYFVGILEPPSEPPTGWHLPGFDDSNWLSGPSSFGDGNGDYGTNISEIGTDEAMSVYIRHSFNVTNKNDVLVALMNIDFDDTFIAWLNGVEIARENIGRYGDFPPFDYIDGLATVEPLGSDRKHYYYFTEEIQSLLVNGSNTIAIQTNTIDTDLTIISVLTLGYATEPTAPLYVSPYAEPNLLNLHTNFKIGNNETVFLSDPSGIELNQLALDDLQLDVSFGRQPDGSSNLYFFNEPTPDASNSTIGYNSQLQEPVIETEAGFYNDTVTISISASGSGETVYYSLDGSVPSDNSSSSYVYNSTFTIDETTNVRARSFKQGYMPSRTVTKTFLINADHYMPVISLTIDPYNWDDYNYGIYAMGPNADPEFPHAGANFWEDWERPVHLEMFETDQSLVLDTDCGIKIFGFASRGHAQKSLALFARGQYGDSSFEHQIFQDKPYSSFQSFVLRNSGGDWCISHIRDGFMAENLKDTNLAYQAFRPAVTYVNGEYWGIYNIREKLNEHFYASNYGVDPDNIDYLEKNASPILGDAHDFGAMMDYIDTHDLSVPEYYDHVCTLLDEENIISYLAAQLWYNNSDWPGANNKYWKERIPGAKWRWQIYDLDLGMALNFNVDFDMFDYLLSGEDWGSPYRNELWATYLYRRLVESDVFVQKLVTRLCDYMNTIWDNVYLENKIDDIFEYLYQEMEDHMIRWEGDFDNWYGNERLVMKYWSNGIENRNHEMRVDMNSEFDLGSRYSIEINVEPEGAGTIQCNSVSVSSFPWIGSYFSDYPVVITAKPADLYQFTGWSGDVNSFDPTITINDSINISIVANFATPYDRPLPIINEINYNSSGTFDSGDWVEIYNPADKEIDLSGWHFKDSDDLHDFEFPQNYILAAKHYVVLCQDLDTFTTNFPDVTNFLGQFGFGLSSSGEYIRLFDNTMMLIDSVYYGVEDPWTSEPNGNGPTLSLKNATMDNNSSGSWSASAGYGTPGARNDNWEPYPPPFSDELAVLQNYPNPFASYSTIKYSIPERGKVQLSVYNMKGQLVKKLVNKVQEIGAFTAVWDGRNSKNTIARSGVYFYLIQFKGERKAGKMVLVR